MVNEKDINFIKFMNIKRRFNFWFIFLTFGLFFIFANSANAKVVVIPATNGSAISADTVNKEYTGLVGPTILEGLNSDIGKGTIILNAPSGFIFDVNGYAPTVLITRIGGTGQDKRNINGLASGSIIPVTRTTTKLTINIKSGTTGGVTNALTWQNIRVRPLLGSPLAFGNITKTGTSSIRGVVSNTNFGILNEVYGIKAKLEFVTQPSTTALVNTEFVTKPIITVKDQFGNVITSDNSTIVDIFAVPSTGSCESIKSNGILTSFPESSSTFSSGLVSYTSMKYSFAENIKICVKSSGIDSALSNSIIIKNLVPQIDSISPTSKIAGSPEFTITVNGSNFVTSSLVNIDGVARSTTFISQTQVTAQIPATDIALSRSINITVSNPSPGGGVSNIEILLVNNYINNTSQFVLDNLDDMNINTRLLYTVTRKDSSGNFVTSGKNTVYLYSSSTSTNKGFYNMSELGDVINSVIIPEGSYSANFWYFDDKVGTWTITASDNSSAPDGSLQIVDGTDNVLVNILPTTATKLIIVDPADSFAGTVVPIIIKAVNSNGNLDSTYNGYVTLLVSGSALGGGKLVNIVNGVGLASIFDTIAEVVEISLSDTRSTGLDILSKQNITFNLNPSYSVGTGTSIFASFSGSIAQNFKIDFLFFPDGNISNGIFFKQIAPDINGNFIINLTDQRIRSLMYALVLVDNNDKILQTKTFNGSLSESISFSNIMFAPTVNLSVATVKQGDPIIISGYAKANALIEIAINDLVISETIRAGANGFYTKSISTSNMPLSKHYVKARQIIGGLTSDFSMSKLFVVSNILNPIADLNFDGTLNNLDIDIFISRWLSTNLQVRSLVDFNKDGEFNSLDLSLFVNSFENQ
jgi:hypothetical protein